MKINNKIKMYADTYPNIEIFYKNNGGRKYAEELFLDRSKVVEKLASIIPLKLIYTACLVMEPFVSFFIVSYLFCKAIIRILTISKLECKRINRLFLLFDDLLMISRCKAAGIFTDSEFWFIRPFATKYHKELEEKSIISAFNMLNFWDIFMSYIYSLSSILYVCWNNQYHYLRQPFKSFEFYLTYSAIVKFPKDTELIFPNHIDRWAVLVEHCPQNRKVLVQHGIESKKADWPVKLSTVTKVYAFNEELGKDLQKALLTNNPEFIFMKATIELTDDGNDNNYKVLIVCHPAAMREREEYLISHLQIPGVTLYAKLHPTTKDVTFYEDLKKKYQYHLIIGGTYPQVNILISYRSTIVYEYEYYGIPTIMYYDKTLDDIINKIKIAADEWNNTINNRRKPPVLSF